MPRAEIERVQIIIRLKDGKKVGWDIGHPDDLQGRITATANFHQNWTSKGQPLDHRFEIRLATDGGYRVLFPGTETNEAAVESMSAIDGIVDGELIE